MNGFERGFVTFAHTFDFLFEFGAIKINDQA